MKRIDFNLNNIPNFNTPLAICLGYFDGLHIGHMELIKKMKESSLKKSLLTLDMDDFTLIKRKEYLTSLEDREGLLKKEDIDYYLVLKFDKVMKNLSPLEFIEKILLPLNIKEIYIGEDYTFGKDKKGNVNLLKEYNDHYFDVKVIPDLKIDDKKISTSLIFEELKNGNIDRVNLLLNRPYKVKGKVEKGFGNGTRYLFPTANISFINSYALPKRGVYEGRCIYENKIYKAMINIGRHPTIDELDKDLLEVYIFDFHQDIYGKIIEIEFISFLREERYFSSVEELKKQLEKDYQFIESKDL